MNVLYLRLFLAAISTLILTILPFPALFFGVKPPFVLLLFLYVQFFLPNYFNITVLLIMGLVLDVLLSTVLGEHALALTFVAWVANSKARRFNLFSVGQQMFLVGFFCMIYQILILMVDAFLGFHPSLIIALANTVASILLWPWVKLVGDECFKVKFMFRR